MTSCVCTEEEEEKKKKTPLRTRQVAARLRRMEPVHQVASLEHSVAKGLTEELQKNHGTRNVLGTLNHCRALLAEAVDVQEKAAHTGKVLVLAGNGESKAEELRKALGSALKKEGEVKHDLEGLERVSSRGPAESGSRFAFDTPPTTTTTPPQSQNPVPPRVLEHKYLLLSFNLLTNKT